VVASLGCLSRGRVPVMNAAATIACYMIYPIGFRSPDEADRTYHKMP
jgi:hypothetical protein